MCQECEYVFPQRQVKALRGSQMDTLYSNGVVERPVMSFEPEREEDGYRKIDRIIARRLIGSDTGGVQTEQMNSFAPAQSTSILLQFSHRRHGNDAPKTRYDYEYLVKYRGLSFKRLEWHAATDLESQGKAARNLLNRFIKKEESKAEDSDNERNEEYFDPIYCEAERVLDSKEFDVEVEHTEQNIATLLAQEEAEDQAVVEKAAAATVATAPISVHNNNSSSVFCAPRTLVSPPPLVGVSRPKRDSSSSPPPVLDDGSAAGCADTAAGVAVSNPVDPASRSSPPLHDNGGVDDSNIQVTTSSKSKEDPIWRPFTRCMRVLEKLEENSWCDIFREPVELEDFPDYTTIVDQPMDLGTIREKLESRNYRRNSPEEFARDVRQVWHNCKVYNKHGSSIWYTADYLSKHFERLYTTWVMDYQDKSIPYDDPQGQPWELSCRKCLLDNRPDDIILCDCCDAEYHTFCLTPKLNKVPDELWQCPRCQFRLAQGERLHSHALEEAARARADNADKTHRIVRVKKYLVKWRGLSYADCTWETQEEINDDEVIAKFHLLNDEPPQEPPLTKEEIAYELNPRNRVVLPAMLDPNSSAEIDARIYAQARAWHFLRHDVTPTVELLKECGAATSGYAMCKNNNKGNDDGVKLELEIMNLMQDMLSSVAQGSKYSANYGPLLPMEFEETIPKVNDSLYLNVAEHGSFVRVESFRSLPDGSPAPVAHSLVCRGNFIVGVNGVECDGLGFDNIVFLLKDSPPFITLRLSNNIVQRAAVRDHIQRYRAQEGHLLEPGMSPVLQHDRLVQWMGSLGIPEGTVDPVSDSEDDEANIVVKPSNNVVPALGSVHRFMVAVCEAQDPPDPDEWKGDIYRCAQHRHVPQMSAMMSYPTDTRRKPIEQLDNTTGRVLNVWDSLTSASKATGIHISCLSQAANGHTSLTGNCTYRYCNVSYEEAVRNWIASSGGMQRAMPTQAQTVAASTPVPPVNAAAPSPVTTEPAAVEPKPEPEPSGVKEEHQFDGSIDLDEGKDEVEVKGFGDWRSHLPVKGADYNGNKLRDYQVEGVRWMLACWYRHRGCILADEMGLGKTVQVTAVLEHLHRVENLLGPFLIVVPLSTIEHWRREIELWTDMILCMYHDISGGSYLRDVIREYEWYYKCRSRRVLKFQVLVTTYDDLIRDTEELSEIPWRSVVVDEAHRLRNRNSKLLECLMTVMQRGMTSYDFQHRILMTGTPLQNNVEELWSLMNFVEPTTFSSRENFMDRYKDMETENQVRSLQKKIAPHMLRRVKEDVAHDIPPKEETMVDVELTMLQKRYYRAIFEKNHAILFQVGGGSARTAMPNLMNIQMELRKCCNHPFLVRGVEDHEVDAMVEDMMKEAGKGMLSEKEVARARLERGLVQCSGKMILLDKLLPKLRSEGHKVLIFSQFIMMLDMLAEYCRLRGYPNETLDGRVLGNERQKAIDRFNADGDSFVFLLSTRAGGVGINLTAADTCIIFDSDWNPQNDIQAMARCHRIGQTKDVKVYRLVSRRSFESEMFVRASKKLGLEQAILGSHDNKESKLSTMEMEKLLREGAYALMEDGEQAMEEFNAMDIERILQQRSHKIVSDTDPKDKKTAEWLSNKVDDVENDNADEKKQKKKKNAFRKSKFQSEETSEDLDVNDPNFWQKVLPDLVTPAILLSRLEEAKLETSKTAAKNYFKDVEKMFSSLVAQQERGSLSNDERNAAVNLLVHISVKVGIFSPQQINSATAMAQRLQGSRLRQSVRGPDASDAMHDGITPPPHSQDSSFSGRSKRRIVGSKDREGWGDQDDGWGVVTKKRARKSVIPLARDLNMDICAICENGGEILMCDGSCNRSFHPECLEMDEVPAGEEWLCPDCSAQVFTCLLCGETGSVKGGPNAGDGNDGEEFVTKCAVVSCGRFYHDTCTQKDDRVRWVKDRKGVESCKCPQHYCRICKKSAAELQKQQPVVKCTRCPNAYHEVCISGLPASSKHHSFLRKGKMMVCCDHELDNREKEELAAQQLRREAAIEADVEEENNSEGVIGGSDGTRKLLKSRSKPVLAPDPQFPINHTFSRKVKEVCGFCGKSSNSDETPEGPFIRPPFAELINNRETPLFAHRMCVLYTPEAYVRVVDPDSSSWSNSQGALDECEVCYYNVVKAKKRARMLRCAHCGNSGSSIGCHNSACDASFHYGCCLETGWIFGEDPDILGKVFYCKDHRSEGQKKLAKKGRKRRNPNGEIVRPSLKGVKSASAPKPKYARGESGGASDPVLTVFEDTLPSIKRFAMVKLIAKLREEDQDMIFEEAITDEEAPGYSDIIEHPICIQTIEQRVKKGRYAESFRCRGMDGFKEDIDIMFANCLHYNQEGSTFWLEAKRITSLLPSIFENAHGEAMKNASHEGASHSGNHESKAVPIRTWDDVNCTVQRRAMTDILAALSARPDMQPFERPMERMKGDDNSNENDTLFGVISGSNKNNDGVKQLMCLQNIRASLANGSYGPEERGASAFQADLRLMFDNSIAQHPRGSSIHENAARFLKGLPRMVRESLKAAVKVTKRDGKDYQPKGKNSSNSNSGGGSAGSSGRGGGEVSGSTFHSKPDANTLHPLVATWKEDTTQSIKEHAMNAVLDRVSALDPDDIFTDPVTDEQAPDYSNIILQPICVKDIMNLLNASGYSEPPEGRGVDGFLEDIVKMYDNCKLYNGEGSELWDNAHAMLSKLPTIFRDALKNARRLNKMAGKGGKGQQSMTNNSSCCNMNSPGSSNDNTDDSINNHVEKSRKTDGAVTGPRMLQEVWWNMDNRERRKAMNTIMSAICKIASTSSFDQPQESNSICWQLINRRIGKGRYLQRGPMSFIGDVQQTLINVRSGDGSKDQNMATEGLEKLPDIVKDAFKVGGHTDIDIDLVLHGRKEEGR